MVCALVVGVVSKTDRHGKVVVVVDAAYMRRSTYMDRESDR